MLWVFREALIAAGALEGLFGKLDQAITAASGKPDDQSSKRLFSQGASCQKSRNAALYRAGACRAGRSRDRRRNVKNTDNKAVDAHVWGRDDLDWQDTAGRLGLQVRAKHGIALHALSTLV